MNQCIVVLFSLIVGACTPKLPHRAEWEVALYRQGNSPDVRHCQTGAIPYFLDDGTFLECMATHDNH